MCQKCKQCEHQLTDERIKLGYDVCVECSDTQKYSSHTVYPHKTGGYIQPVSSEKSDVHSLLILLILVFFGGFFGMNCNNS